MRARNIAALLSLLGTILTVGSTPAAARRAAETGEPPPHGVSAPHVQLDGPHAEAPSDEARPEPEPASASASPQSAADPEAPPSPAGDAAAFGENWHGQLGVFYRDSWEVSPVGVEALSGIVQLAGTGSFNLALLSNGTVASWGGDGSGQLGDDAHRASWEQGVGHVMVGEEDPVTHAVLGPLHGVEQVAAGTHHAIALMQDGTVMTWGGDLYGEMGDGVHGWERQFDVNMRLPKAVPGLSAIKAVTAGGGSDYALTEVGTVLAWGNDSEGQLGIGEPGPEHCETETAHYPRYKLCSSHPLPVVWRNPQTGRQEDLREVTAVATGGFAGYALLRDGHVVAWGGDRHGQLATGPGAGAGENAPAEVRTANGTPLSGVVELAAGTDFVLARTESGQVLGWGSDARDALAGIGGEDCGSEATGRRARKAAKQCTKQPTPIPALEALHPEALSAGHFYGLALAHGSVYAWGEDEYGQLGGGHPRSKGVRATAEPRPTRVAGIGDATAVVAAVNHSLVLLAPGVAPPPPLLSARPEPLSLDLSWASSASNGEAFVPERLLYRMREPEGEAEPSVQGQDEAEEGPPFNLETEPAYIELKGVQLEGQPIVAGQVLGARAGGWGGAGPIRFSYRWQRCSASGESCAYVTARPFGRYKTTAADVGYTLRAVITATGREGSEVAYTAPSGIVTAASEAEAGPAPASSVHLSAGLSGYDIRDTVERVPDGSKAPLEVLHPLQATAYQIVLRASSRNRTMFLTPLQ